MEGEFTVRDVTQKGFSFIKIRVIMCAKKLSLRSLYESIRVTFTDIQWGEGIL